MNATDPYDSEGRPAVRSDITERDAGLRAYLLKVYNYMAGALVLTGIMAFYASQSEAFLYAMYVIQDGQIVGMKALAWIVMLAPLGFVIAMSLGIERMSLPAMQMAFWVYAGLMGLSLSSIFLVFTGESIVRVFFITAGTFGAMSLYGYTTDRDLSGWGSFLLMGLIGIIIAALVNLFLQSAGLQFAVSVIGVLVFVGLTAYDTQRLKHIYYQFSEKAEWLGKLAVFGALSLYLDFINLFLSLMHLFGNRR